MCGRQYSQPTTNQGPRHEQHEAHHQRHHHHQGSSQGCTCRRKLPFWSLGCSYELDRRGTLSRIQDSVEDALLAFLLSRKWAELGCEDDDLLADQTVSVNVERQEDGQLLYEVVFDMEGSDYGTNCKVKDLVTLDEWFDEEWITEAD